MRRQSAMRRLFALLWLVILLVLGGHLLWSMHTGLRFSTDILALLPREAETPIIEQANEAVTETFSRRIVLLVGDQDRATARMAATALQETLHKTGLVKVDADAFSEERLKK